MTPHDLLDRAIGKFEDVLDVLGFARPEGSNIKNRRACALCEATNKTTFSYRPNAGLRADAIDIEIQRLESATPAELVVIRREPTQLWEAA